MAAFDIIDAAGNGYKIVWNERNYLARLAFVPLMIKLICHIAVYALDWQDQYFRQALVMLPSFIADGWMLAHQIRLIFLDQRWPYRPTGNETKDIRILETRARGIMAGMLMFATIRFLMAGFMAYFLSRGEQAAPLESAPPGSINLAATMMAMVLVMFSIWAFRFLWYYIPAALNYPLRKFTRDIGEFKTSFYMIGTWLVGYIPLFFILIMLIECYTLLR